jgi:hypothetical protein
VPDVPIKGTGQTLQARAMLYSLRKSDTFGDIRSYMVGVLLAVCCAGCVSSEPIGSTTRPNVIVLRGPAGYFPNLADFENRLIDEGTCPTVAYPQAEGTIAERIIGGRNQGRLKGPIVIVGYSAGANAAVSLSERLGTRGIDVDKLVLVEASDSKRVPQNVHACLNIYKSEPWGEQLRVLAGHPLEAQSSATELFNYDIREYNDGRFDWENHLTLVANPHVQDLMIEEVLATFEETATASNTEPQAESDNGGNDDSGASRAGAAEDVSPPPGE